MRFYYISSKKVIREFYEKSIEEGKSIESIAKIRRLKPETVYRYFVKHNILKKYREKHPLKKEEKHKERYGLKKRKNQQSDLRELYKKLVEENNTATRIASKRKIKRVSVYSALRRYGLLDEYKKRHPGELGDLKGIDYTGIEEVIKYERTMENVGKHYGVTREMIRHVLNERGLYNTWKELKRTYKKRRKDTMRRLVEILYIIAWNKTKAIKPCQQAMRFYFGTKTRIDFDILVKFFNKYYRSKEESKLMTLKELTEDLGISFTSAGKILRRVGEEPLYGTRKRKSLTKNQYEIVEEAVKFDTKLSYPDMGRLIGISKKVFALRAKKLGIKRTPECVYNDAGNWVGYAKSMDLFEALDAEFSIDEAKEYAGIKTDATVDFIVSHRNDIEREVNKFLKEIKMKSIL